MFDLLSGTFSFGVLDTLTTTVFPLTRELLLQGAVGAALMVMVSALFPSEEGFGRGL